MSTAAAAGGDVVSALFARFGEASFTPQETRDETPALWVERERAGEVLAWLARGSERPFPMLYDLSAVDERDRTARDGLPPADFSLVYHLLAPERSEEVRLKVALRGEHPSHPTATGLWTAAGWYEREAWDMFGVRFEGHPDLRRILMPRTWQGHPLRREHPARATEMGPFALDEARRDAEDEALEMRPEEWGLVPGEEDDERMVLNVGPQHPGTHGVLRIALRLDGERIVDAAPEIGFHHRGVEKMAERQTWHTFIPYTDRVDYLSGVLNNLPYVLAVEKLCGIEVPERAQVIRVMLAELFRVASHLVWYGTFAQDLGALSPVFYTFSDRERVFDVVEAICGGRMHPNWFRIGGVAQDLPRGWEDLIRPLLEELPRRLDEYDAMVMRNRIFRDRTQGVGSYTADEALRWGVTGPGLRACGVEWDLRKKRPYSGYDRFDFDVATASAGDCYDRGVVRVEEMRQSLRIVGQCVDRMPGGPVKADHPLSTPPPRERTMRDIETLITHFLGESWGPVVPPGEAGAVVEGSKGLNGYHLISDGGTSPYRVRIRTPSFPHLQMLPAISRGGAIPDLLAILGSIDYVLADVDR